MIFLGIQRKILCYSSFPLEWNDAKIIMEETIDISSYSYEEILTFVKSLDKTGGYYTMDSITGWELRSVLSSLSKSIFAVFLQYYDLVHWQWQWTWAQKMNVLQNAYLEISFYLHGLRIYLREVSVLWCICTTSGGNSMPILMESAMLVTPQVKLFLVGDQTYRLFKEGMIFNLYELVRTLDMGQAISNSTWNLFCEKLF